MLYGARHPPDWYGWLLDQAANAQSEALARYCFDNAANAAIDPSADVDITMERVEQWVGMQVKRWPNAGQWLEHAWSLPLDHWQGKHRQIERDYLAQRLARDAERQCDLVPYAAAINAGTAPAGLMYHMALAYRDRLAEVNGDTPQSRLQNFFAGDAGKVALALNGFERALARDDLPTVADILKSHIVGREHYIRPACLIGAEIACQRDGAAPTRWSDDLARRLVAFWLTDGTGDAPAWYAQLACDRPALVAEVLGAITALSIRKRPDSALPGLWSLAVGDEQRELACLVLPGILQGFPARAKAAQLRRLNQELLPAAVRHLGRAKLGAIAEKRLALKSLDAGQRIAWLVATLTLDAERASQALIGFVGSSQTRSVQLGVALVSQGERWGGLLDLPPRVLATLIERLAPHAVPEYPKGGFWVGDSDRRRDLVRGLLRRLTESGDEWAIQELARLRGLPALAPWAIALDAARVDLARQLRSARFQHASPGAVALTLVNRQPANASDLFALTLDHLHDLATHIRHDETNGVRPFWRRDRDGHPVPEIENTCRDRLIPGLREKLRPMSVQLEKEASAENDSRADMRVSAFAQQRRVVVPIEVKKEDDVAVWSAWHDQLDGRYATDPAAQGFGIYLVLWFGHKPRASPEGMRPRSAEEFAQLLSSRIPAEDRARLAIAVLDLTWPA